MHSKANDAHRLDQTAAPYDVSVELCSAADHEELQRDDPESHVDCYGTPCEKERHMIPVHVCVGQGSTRGRREGRRDV